jgi:hypothetical protein
MSKVASSKGMSCNMHCARQGRVGQSRRRRRQIDVT